MLHMSQLYISVNRGDQRNVNLYYGLQTILQHFFINTLLCTSYIYGSGFEDFGAAAEIMWLC